MRPWYATPWVILSLVFFALVVMVLIAWIIYKQSKKPKRKPKTLLSPLYTRRELKNYMDNVFINMPQIQDMPTWINWAELKHKAMPSKYGYWVDFDAIRGRLGMEFKNDQLPKQSHRHNETIEQLNIYEFLQEQDALLKRYLEDSLAKSNVELEKVEREYTRAIKEKRQRRRNVRIRETSVREINTKKTFLYIAIGVLLLGIWGVLFLLLFHQ